MTAEEVRDLNFVSWRDPHAWMENMKGKRWETLIQKEKRHFHELSSQAHVKHLSKQMENEIKDASQYGYLTGFTVGGGTVDLTITPQSRIEWKWSWEKKSIPVEDITVDGNMVWYIVSDNTKYTNTLICKSADGKIRWKKESVSADVAVIGTLCYYIKITGYYEFSELCACNALSGKEEDMLYREKNEERYISLLKEANHSLYLVSSDPLSTSTYRIQEKELLPIYPKTTEQWPLGEAVAGHECILTRSSSIEKWTTHGHPISEWKLPEDDLEWINPQTGHVITMKEGGNTLWFCATNRPPKILLRLKVGSINPNPWSAWENQLLQHFIVRCPTHVPFMIQAIQSHLSQLPNSYRIERPLELKPLEVHRFHTPSADSTMVPYVMIMEKGVKPKAMFVYVYGAYGSSTPIDWPYQSWYPLLSRKWAVVFALVRGGGDVDSAWADAARTDHRHRAIDDFEAVIRAAQQKLRCGPEKTVIYGRSAGGLPVGAMVSRHPNGELMGAAFTEVPYVDVLRTSSNPDLPLTIGEYKEFGNPMTNILHFKELMAVSPVNTVPDQGAPGVFVMSHVGLLDKQVFAYESFKWIQRLRGNGRPDQDPQMKYVTFERDEAHQYRFHRLPRFRAIDLAILDTWVDGKLRFN